MTRIPYPDDGDLSDAARRALAGVPPLNIFKILAHGDVAFPNFLRLAGGLWNDAELSPRRRELAILHVARITGAEYEWHQHVEVARLVGISDAEIAALEQGVVETLPEDEQVLLALVHATVDRRRCDDELFTRARDFLSDREIVELHLLVAVYAGLAALMIGLDIDLDERSGAELLESGPRGPRLG